MSNSNTTNQIKTINIELFQLLSPINKIDKSLIENDIINKINNSQAEFLIFAENNYPYLVSDLNNISIMKHLKNDQKIIIGSTRIENNKFYNSFLFLEKNNIQIFDKQILVPFGEFLPLRSYLKFMEKITGNVDFAPGIHKRLIQSNDINVLPVVCYEIIFNKILKDVNKNKIDILINITNDSWFGNQFGPYQHFSKAVYRSIEEGIFIARSANKGISAYIDPNGRVIKSLEMGETGNIEINFPYFARSTLFSNYGNKIFALIVLLYIFLILIFKKLKI